MQPSVGCHDQVTIVNLIYCRALLCGAPFTAEIETTTTELAQNTVGTRISLGTRSYFQEEPPRATHTQHRRAKQHVIIPRQRPCRWSGAHGMNALRWKPRAYPGETGRGSELCMCEISGVVEAWMTGDGSIIDVMLTVSPCYRRIRS